MTEGASELTRSLILLWGRLSMEGRVDAVMSLSLLAYYLARDARDEKLQELARSWLSIASEDWLKGSPKPKPGSEAPPSCSFCGKREPEVRLAAGAKAFICDSCVQMLSRTFLTDTIAQQ